MSGEELQVLHGLPPKVQFCARCVMSNQKPNTSIEYLNKDANRTYIGFDEEGVCAACRFAEKKERIDWKEREERLLELLAGYRRHDGSPDVIVPVSGGKDSAFTAHVLKHKYGMHPLTVTWSPHLYTEVGWQNLQGLINQGELDNILYTPNGKVHSLLTRLAFLNLLHPFQPFVFGQKNLGPRMSILHKVPLVMYGESNLEYGDPSSSDDEEMTTDFFSLDRSLDETYIGGVQARALLDRHGLDLADLMPYLPIDPRALREAGTKVHYLGHYLKWDPQECFYYASEHTGFRTAADRSEGTYSKYTEIDDKLIPLHFYCMHVKFGIGRCTYDASQEIRTGKIDREEGVALVRKYDAERPARWLPEVLRYMGLTEEEFDAVVDRFRSPHLWTRTDGGWRLRQPVA